MPIAQCGRLRLTVSPQAWEPSLYFNSQNTLKVNVLPLGQMGPLGGLRPPQSPFKENSRLGLLNVCLCCSFQHSTARRVRHGLHIPKRQQAREFSNQMPHTSCCHNICIMLPLKPLPSMPHSSKARKKIPIGLRRRPAPSVNSVRSSIGSICRLRPCFVNLKTSEDAEPTTTPDSNQQVVQSGHDTPLKQGQSLVIGICGSVYVWVPACAMMCSCGVHIGRGPDSPSDPL